jgi:hypothetical protein
VASSAQTRRASFEGLRRVGLPCGQLTSLARRRRSRPRSRSAVRPRRSSRIGSRRKNNRFRPARPAARLPDTAPARAHAAAKVSRPPDGAPHRPVFRLTQPKQLEAPKKNPKLKGFTDTSWIEGHLVFRRDLIRSRSATSAYVRRAPTQSTARPSSTRFCSDRRPSPTLHSHRLPMDGYFPDATRLRPAQAKALLAAASYPDGVEVGLVVFAPFRVLGEEVDQAVGAQLSHASRRGSKSWRQE